MNYSSPLDMLSDPMNGKNAYKHAILAYKKAKRKIN